MFNAAFKFAVNDDGMQRLARERAAMRAAQRAARWERIKAGTQRFIDRGKAAYNSPWMALGLQASKNYMLKLPPGPMSAKEQMLSNFANPRIGNLYQPPFHYLPETRGSGVNNPPVFPNINNDMPNLRKRGRGSGGSQFSTPGSIPPLRLSMTPGSTVVGHDKPVKVVQTVAAPSARTSTTVRRGGDRGIMFSLAEMFYPRISVEALRGNLLMGPNAVNYTSTLSDTNVGSFSVTCGAVGNILNSPGQRVDVSTLSYDWSTGFGMNSGNTAENVEGQANQNVVDYGLYPCISLEFMPQPNISVADHAPNFEMYGRSWYGDPYNYNGALRDYTLYPDFKFCPQGSQCRQTDADLGSQSYSFFSYAGLQGVLELDGFLQGNQMAMYAQTAFDNSIMGRKLEQPGFHMSICNPTSVANSGDVVSVFDATSLGETAQMCFQYGQNVGLYDPMRSMWTASRTVAGLDIPFNYEIADTLHISNLMDVPVVVNLEIFECKEDISSDYTGNSDLFQGYNETYDICPNWQLDLNSASDNTSARNGFYSGMTGTSTGTDKARRVYDVGRTADGHKKVNKWWRCVGKKHFKLEALQEVSHTYKKQDVINLKNLTNWNVQDSEAGGIGTQLAGAPSNLPTIAWGQNVARTPTPVGPVGPKDNSKIGDVPVFGEEKNLSNNQVVGGPIMTHVDTRIKKYIKGHTYKYILTWFGLKQMAFDSSSGSSDVPDNCFIRNGRAAIVTSRSCEASYRIGPQTKKSFRYQQKFGPIGNHAGGYEASFALDADLTSSGFTRPGGEIKPVDQPANP